MTPKEAIDQAILPALELLPDAMDTPEARVMLLAISMQESRLEHRRQLGNGPARGLWQFERGGVRGVFNHEASRYWLDRLCSARRVLFNVDHIYPAIERDDVLAAGVARLLLFTDRARLPDLRDQDAAWSLYARTWRPGRPHPETWPKFHATARACIEGSDQ